MSIKNNHNFTVIKGGPNPPSVYTRQNLRFIESYVTDTRLMGVLGLYIAWEFETEDKNDKLHQFFYYDAEEYGLDTYESLIGDNDELIKLIEQNLIGGLGGEKSILNEAEALNLLNSFVLGSKKLNTPLAKPSEEYLPLLDLLPVLSNEEKKLLTQKTCTPIVSKYQLIHYFLMRSFALDQEGAAYLIQDTKNPLTFSWSKPSTLCKNTIEEHIDANNKISYLCEALIDNDGNYEMVLLEITVADMKISSAKINSSFKVSPVEAVMMLNRSEFVSVYEILSDPADFDEIFLPEMASSLKTYHNNGRLFMKFNKNNEHVNQKEFRLNEDVYGIFYVSDYGQLILASYDLNKIHNLEKFLQKGPLSLLLLPTAKYEFKEPIVYDFVQSSFEDFEDFILSLQ